MKSLVDETRYPAGVVQVSMRQDYRIDLSCRDWKILPVTLAPFLLPLKQAAVDKDLNSAFAADVSGVNEVLGSGNDSGSAQELDIAQAVLAFAQCRATSSPLVCSFTDSELASGS